MSAIPTSVTQEQFRVHMLPIMVPITDANGFILVTTGIIAGHHNDAFELKDTLRTAFKFIKNLGISIAGRYFNADSAFDTKAARWTCFNHQLIPNIAENKRARKKTKRGRKPFFNAQVYMQPTMCTLG